MRGRIYISKLKIPPEKHELETARFFAERGHDIEFIPPNYSPEVHTPDIIMDGVAWEIKCPKGKSKRTIENNFRKAAKQSRNIIIDLRRINLKENICITQIRRELQGRPYIKRLLIIKRNEELIDVTRKDDWLIREEIMLYVS